MTSNKITQGGVLRTTLDSIKFFVQSKNKNVPGEMDVVITQLVARDAEADVQFMKTNDKTMTNSVRTVCKCSDLEDELNT